MRLCVFVSAHPTTPGHAFHISVLPWLLSRLSNHIRPPTSGEKNQTRHQDRIDLPLLACKTSNRLLSPPTASARRASSLLRRSASSSRCTASHSPWFRLWLPPMGLLFSAAAGRGFPTSASATASPLEASMVPPDTKRDAMGRFRDGKGGWPAGRLDVATTGRYTKPFPKKGVFVVRKAKRG